MHPFYPPGYRLDRYRELLGRGAACYESAKAALQRWEMFNFDWVRLHPSTPPLEAGTNIGIAARIVFLWSMSYCRIAYTLENKGEVERFGFGLGTLPGHVLSEEERFCVEWNHADVGTQVDGRNVLVGHKFAGPGHVLQLGPACTLR